MPSFDEMFTETKGAPIQYQGMTLTRLDRFPTMGARSITVVRESCNSEWKQGVRLKADGQLTIAGIAIPKGKAAVLWQDTAPAEVVVSLRKNVTEILVNNVWDFRGGGTESWYNGAAMIVEETDTGRRYRCNDGHPDENFDDIVFRVQRD